MGIRDRIRRRAARLVGTVVRSALGRGGQDMGPVLHERTSAWPAESMGVNPVEHLPRLHPVDAVARGLPVAFAAGDWSETAAVAEPEVVAEPEPIEEPALESFDPFVGSVSQGEYFPEPAAQVEEEPSALQVAEVAEVEADKPDKPDMHAPTEGEPADDGEQEELRTQIIEQLETIFDPEIPVNIYALGLIYDVNVMANRNVDIKMTLTSPNCPAAQELPAEVELKAAGVDGVYSAFVDIVWEPVWGPHLMSEAAKLELNIW